MTGTGCASGPTWSRSSSATSPTRGSRPSTPPWSTTSSPAPTREIAEEQRTRAALKLPQPEPGVEAERRRRARENPFLRFRRDSRTLSHHVDLLALEASGAAWALNELAMDDQDGTSEPDEHDRKVFALVRDVLDEVRVLHYELREQTVGVLEVADRVAPADQVAALLEQVDAAAEPVHLQAVDRLWEMERERIGKPRRFHRRTSV